LLSLILKVLYQKTKLLSLFIVIIFIFKSNFTNILYISLEIAYFKYKPLNLNISKIKCFKIQFLLIKYIVIFKKSLHFKDT